MKNMTKSTLALIAIMCFTGAISAQTVGQGAWMLGGSIGFSSQKYKDADASFTYLEVNPTAGYFVIDDLAVGLGVGFSSWGYDGESNSSFGLGPFARYYVTDPIFVQVGADLTLSDDIFGSDNEGVTFGAAVGYSWFLNNGVAIEPTLFFNAFSSNDDDSNNYSIFGISIGIQAFANHDHGME